MLNLQDPKAREQFRAVALVSQLGLASGIPVVVCALAGYYLEQRYPAKGVIVMVCVLVGVAAGVAAAYKVVAPFLVHGNDKKK